MKTAVSIPDAVFDEADALARRMRVSRSRLYAKAVAAFVASRRRKGVREALDDVYAHENSGVDAVLARMQASSLPREKW
jgi:metal-responsive CopG/Arc/MetJ family transcriptional regulator